MEAGLKIGYASYGNGDKLLFAFHGYGLNGNQFQILEKSLCSSYRVIGIHLPYHDQGPATHIGWMAQLIDLIEEQLETNHITRFSIAGYSIGAKISLHLVHYFKDRIDKIYLFAPYGLENHWGLNFVSRGIGNAFFRAVVKTTLPERIMRLVKLLRVIDDVHYQIIEKEMNSQNQKLNLCFTLSMIGELKTDRNQLIADLNKNEIATEIAYGNRDVLFPYKRRNKALLQKLNNNRTSVVEENHWLVTKKLDEVLQLKNQFA